MERCRAAGVALAPTFVPFTPWTTVEGYIELLEEIERLDLVEAVAPIQLAIRLLVTAESKLLELPDIRGLVAPFDPESLTWPWRHADARVDALQTAVMRIASLRTPRSEAFAAIAETAYAVAGRTARPAPGLTLPWPGPGPRQAPPYMTEEWYCCAEPGPEQADLV